MTLRRWFVPVVALLTFLVPDYAAAQSAQHDAATPAPVVHTAAPAAAPEPRRTPAPRRTPMPPKRAAYVVEVDNAGHVVRLHSSKSSKDAKYDALTRSKALKASILTEAGTATSGIYELTYMLDPKSQQTTRTARFVSSGHLEKPAPATEGPIIVKGVPQAQSTAKVVEKAKASPAPTITATANIAAAALSQTTEWLNRHFVEDGDPSLSRANGTITVSGCQLTQTWGRGPNVAQASETVDVNWVAAKHRVVIRDGFSAGGKSFSKVHFVIFAPASEERALPIVSMLRRWITVCLAT